ncbi:response regulator [Desulfococcaceae bacterium HSG7]|nr:response regulator [Desulfococcaceae bacterium HSG7]
MAATLRILILEDNPYDAEIEIALLEKANYACQWKRIESQSEFMACLNAPDYDLIIADYNLPDFNGRIALELFRQYNLDIPFIIVSGAIGDEKAIECLKSGATDYVLKDRLLRLESVVRRCLHEKEKQHKLKRNAEERAELEKLLHQAQYMEALGVLSSGIAHDFNNCLTVIRGYAEIALARQLPEDHAASDSMKQILNASRRATDLVKQILASSRREEQKMTQIGVMPIIKETLKLLRASLPANIEIRQNLTAQSDIITGDASQFHQVLMNLCTNAGHAMSDEGGILTVDLQETDMDYKAVALYPELKPGHYLCLSVSDTGCGVSALVRKRIFEPYFTTKAKDEGTGLGLAVIHGIVSTFGGAVRVESEPGLGSIFKLFFPCHASAQKPIPEWHQPIMGGSEHILIIDDEPVITKVGRILLKQLGYHVTTMTDSIAALEKFGQQPKEYDLVITDLSMPKLNGDRLAQQLIRIRPDIPIILCTGHDKQIWKEKAHAIGIHKMLMKPFSRIELAETIRNTLGKGLAN